MHRTQASLSQGVRHTSKHQRSIVFLSVFCSFLACSSAQHLDLPAESRPTPPEDKASSTPSADSSSQSSLDSEDRNAAPPTQIAGAFLTAECEELTTESYDDRATFGCNIRKNRKNLPRKDVQLTQFEVFGFGKNTSLKGDAVDDESGEFHQLFKVNKPKEFKLSHFLLQGRIAGSQMSFNRPIGPESKLQDCLEEQIKENMFSSIMDYRTSREPLALGQKAVKLFESTEFNEGDRIFLENAQGKSLTRTLEQKLILNDQFNLQCPLGWVLTLVDERGNIVLEYDLKERPVVTIPSTAISVWLGFKEKLVAFYSQNEGGALSVALPNSTNGCKFKFVREPKSCLSR